MNSAVLESNEGLDPDLIGADYVFADALVEIYPKLRLLIDGQIKLQGMALEKRAAGQLVMKLQRNAEAVASINRAQLQEETYPLNRLQSERLVTLFYVLYAGPRFEPGKPSSEFALQYLEHEHWSKYELFRLHPDVAKRISLNRHPSLEAYEEFVAKLAKEASEADSRWNYSSNGGKNWTPHTFETLSARVVEHLPEFATDWAREKDEPYFYFRFQSHHTHGTSFSDSSMRTQEAEALFLTDHRNAQGVNASVAALEAMYGWTALGELYGSQIKGTVVALWEQAVSERDPNRSSLIRAE